MARKRASLSHGQPDTGEHDKQTKQARGIESPYGGSQEAKVVQRGPDQELAGDDGRDGSRDPNPRDQEADGSNHRESEYTGSERIPWQRAPLCEVSTAEEQ